MLHLTDRSTYDIKVSRERRESTALKCSRDILMTYDLHRVEHASSVRGSDQNSAKHQKHYGEIARKLLQYICLELT